MFLKFHNRTAVIWDIEQTDAPIRIIIPAMVPYCLSGTGEYCSYDDSVSIKKKAQYCVEKGFGGAIIWELKAGTSGDGSSPLLDAAASVLLPSATVVAKSVADLGTFALKLMTISNCPAVNFSLEKASKVQFAMYDLAGRSIRRIHRDFPAGNNSFSLPEMNTLKSGRYVLRVTFGTVQE